MIYKGVEIELVEAVNIGYAPARFNKKTHTITPRSRKVTVWYIHWPDGGTSTADTLKAAKERVDAY